MAIRGCFPAFQAAAIRELGSCSYRELLDGYSTREWTRAANTPATAPVRERPRRARNDFPEIRAKIYLARCYSSASIYPVLLSVAFEPASLRPIILTVRLAFSKFAFFHPRRYPPARNRETDGKFRAPIPVGRCGLRAGSLTSIWAYGGPRAGKRINIVYPERLAWPHRLARGYLRSGAKKIK